MRPITRRATLQNEALAYYLENSAASARVTIHHRGVEVPAVMDYLVGPLPMGPQTAIRPLKDSKICHRKDIPFDARSLGDIEELPLFLAREVGLIAQAMEVPVSMHSFSYLIHFLHMNFSAVLSEVTRTIPS